MYNLIWTYNQDKIKLIKDITHYRDNIDFYLVSNDLFNANKFERKIKSAIDCFNIMYDSDFKEGINYLYK